MRLTDEQIAAIFWGEEMTKPLNWGEMTKALKLSEAAIATVRRCLALAALPDEQKPYEDVERRGFSVSQPGELPR